MQAIINFLGIRRFNYLDLIGLWLFILLWQEGQYILAIVATGLLLLASITIEHYVRRL